MTRFSFLFCVLYNDIVCVCAVFFSWDEEGVSALHIKGIFKEETHVLSYVK